MKVIYNKPRGQRIKKGSIKIKYCGEMIRLDNFIGLSHWRKSSEELLYWSEDINKWIMPSECDDPKVNWISSENSNVKNLKSAIRHIKKHSEIPTGTKMILASRFKGYDIIIIK